MIIFVDGKWYNGKQHPIVVYLTDEDKMNIMKMAPEAAIISEFPDDKPINLAGLLKLKTTIEETNLCDVCEYDMAFCLSSPVFGNGKGKDNVIGCGGFLESVNTFMKTDIRPITLLVANRFVIQYHRHNKKVVGAKFAIGLYLKNELVGVGIVGRPVNRHLDDGPTAEITRVCVRDGIKNGNSRLYGRLRKICQCMGYRKIITYTLENESQSSLLAVGAKISGTVKPGEWSCKSRPRATQQAYKQQKLRWEL